MGVGDLGVLMVHAHHNVYRLEGETAVTQHLANVDSIALANPQSKKPVS